METGTGAGTPMIEQYRQLKQQHPDAILLFRLGDFYEMFFEDAEVGSRELELTLTGRDGGKALGRVPMCGVPHHAAQGYIQKLIEKGYRVAVCEQVEDPRQARGLVRREVTRVITPGTVSDPALLEERRATLICALACAGAEPRPGGGRGEVVAAGSPARLGLATADASTGEFAATELEGREAFELLRGELHRLAPAEVIYDAADPAARDLVDRLRPGLRAVWTGREAATFHREDARARLMRHWRVESLRGHGLAGLPAATAAAGALLAYLQETQRAELAHFSGIAVYHPGQFMLLDPATRRNLELTRRLSDGGRRGTLLEAVDRTLTSMGGRLLQAWLERPLTDRREIEARLDAVQALVDDGFARQDLRAALRRVHDVQRLAGRIATERAGARELVALAASLRPLPEVKALLRRLRSDLLARLDDAIDPLPELCARIGEALVDDPPVSLTEGGLIRPGHSAEVDELRELSQGARRFIAALEERERQRTGIRSLKVGYNKVFGYYLEVTNANRAAVPEDYIRKQTLANAERYVTPELKEQEERINRAEGRLAALEYELFLAVRREAARHVEALQRTAGAVAALDALAGLAEAAVANGYRRPEVNDGDEIEIRDGRHPVVELSLGRERFVPNDARLNGSDRRLLIVTGPNMGGKSTYLRQVALIVLLAQVGSFVPARTARVGLCDRIFTRIGATDDLGQGLSTFMVEMTETAHILHAASRRSLVVLDEIGRGTSTFDGLSIAWAVAERIADPARNGARTLFATHYHELTELERQVPGVVNCSVAVRERGEDVVFLHRIVAGGADRSYGLHVARLAGLPPDVLERAREVLQQLEQQRHLAADGRRAALEAAATRAVQLTFLEAAPHPVVEELRRLDPLELTPRQALERIFAWQERIKQHG